MDEMYCLLITKPKLAEELGVSRRTVERRGDAHEYLALNERVSGHAWVAIECDASPERQWYLEILVKDLRQRIGDQEHRLSQSQALHAEAEKRRREERAKAQRWVRENRELTDQVKHLRAAAQSAKNDAATAKQETAQQKAEHEDSVAEMTDVHQRQLDDQQQELEKRSRDSIESYNYQHEQASKKEKRLEDQSKFRMWVGMLTGAAVCGVVTVGSVFLLGWTLRINW